MCLCVLIALIQLSLLPTVTLNHKNYPLKIITLTKKYLNNIKPFTVFYTTLISLKNSTILIYFYHQNQYLTYSSLDHHLYAPVVKYS